LLFKVTVFSNSKKELKRKKNVERFL